ncbi:hypothetical protein [Photobacterium leiognathi]|uniref:hypothetical protein n=1 Tax=Photobacterium leiognathi TaxID=553611 RepID=UPI002981AC5C|nr:hypothetical protein [Photobacterium leiognathi]
MEQQAGHIEKTRTTLQLINRTLDFKESSIAYKNDSDVIGIMCAASNHLISRCDRSLLPSDIGELKRVVKYAVININSVLEDAEQLGLHDELAVFTKLYKHWLPLKKQANELVGVIVYVDDLVMLKNHVEDTKLNRCAMFFSEKSVITSIFESFKGGNDTE